MDTNNKNSNLTLWLKNYTPKPRSELKKVSNKKIKSTLETLFDNSRQIDDPSIQEFYEDVALIIKEEIPELIDNMYIDFYSSDDLENLPKTDCKTICIAMFTYLLCRFIATKNKFENEEGELKLRILIYNIINRDHIYDENNRDAFYQLFKIYKEEKEFTDEIEDISSFLANKTHQVYFSYVSKSFLKAVAGYLNGLMTLYWSAKY